MVVKEVGFLMPPGPHYWLSGAITADWLTAHGIRAEAYLFWTMEQALHLIRRTPRRRWVIQALFEPDPTPLLNLKETHMDGLSVLLDDDIWNPPPWLTRDNLSCPTPHGVAAVEKTLRAADQVIARTEPLATTAERYNKNVVCIPYALGPGLATSTSRGGAVRVGWGGSGTHDGDLEMLRTPLLRLMSEFDIQLVFVSAIPYWASVLKSAPDARAKTLELYPASKIAINGRTGLCLTDHPEYLRFLASQQLDIFMAPLLDHPYNVARDGVKALDAFHLGLPLIASDVGPYRRRLRHTDTAWLVPNEVQAWQDGLAELIKSEPLRHELARRGREWFIGNGTIDTTGPMWVDALGVGDA